MFTCSLPILLFVLRSMNSTGDIVGYCGRWSILRTLLGSTRQYGGGASITPATAPTSSFPAPFGLLFDVGVISYAGGGSSI